MMSTGVGLTVFLPLEVTSASFLATFPTRPESFLFIESLPDIWLIWHLLYRLSIVDLTVFVIDWLIDWNNKEIKKTKQRRQTVYFFSWHSMRALYDSISVRRLVCTSRAAATSRTFCISLSWMSSRRASSSRTELAHSDFSACIWHWSCWLLWKPAET